MLQDFRDIPPTIKAKLPAELKNYLRKYLIREAPYIKGFTAARRIGIFMADPATVRRNAGYYLEEALNYLTDATRPLSGDSGDEARDRSKGFCNLFLVLDFRCLPVCDAESILPELAGFTDAYQHYHHVYTSQLKEADRIVRRAAMAGTPLAEMYTLRLILYADAALSIRPMLGKTLNDYANRLGTIRPSNRLAQPQSA